MEDRREVFEILARAEPADPGALDAAFAACQRDDGKFVPAILLAGTLELPFDELAALRATIGTVTPLIGADEALRAAVEAAKDLLALPDLMAAPAVAGGLTRRIEQAFVQGKRAVPGRVPRGPARAGAARAAQVPAPRGPRRAAPARAPALRRRRRRGRPPAGGKPASPASIVVYLPEATAALVPLQARFRVRFVGEIRLAADPGEAHPAALRVLALGRAAPIRR